ncbi:hypothetical protein FRB93_007672 [Tulasnella sp. JGI-2019a]|nr:hypothetical protein FRB93_007672 [Tulasnella sp. JGI-2019a]
MHTRILVVNPNSSVPITDTLKNSIACPPGCILKYLTGPPSAPPSIDDDKTSLQSEEACFPLLNQAIFNGEIDAILIACYSDHPLVHSLKSIHPSFPIIGIFEASIAHALLLGQAFGIVTTGAAWESALSTGVAKFLGFDSKSLGIPDMRQWRTKRFVGVESTGLGVNELHEADQEEVASRIGAAAKSLVTKGADVICLGCAGMSGTGRIVASATEGRVTVVDGVQAGVDLLAGLVHRKNI